VPGIDWDITLGPNGLGCYGLPGESENCVQSCTTPITWYADTDNDGLGDAGEIQSSCSQPAGYVANADDACPVDTLNTCTIVHDVPGLIQAEAYTVQQGVQREDTSDAGGGMNIGFIENGDYTEYQSSVMATGVYDVSFRVASDTQGGTITIMSNTTEVGSINVPNTGGWQSWQTIQTSINLSEGNQNIRIVYSGGAGFLFNINTIQFSSSVLSVNDINQENVKMYPNPASNTVFIEGLKKEHTFVITDITGKVLKSLKLSSQVIHMDISDLGEGLYLVIDQETNAIYKFVKS